MSYLGGNRTVKRWVCCACHEALISMNLGDCPSCEHSRCIDCDVKSHVATDAEIEEDMKIASVSTQSSSQAQPLRLLRGREGEGSQPRGMNRQSIGTRASPAQDNLSEQIAPLSHRMNVALTSSMGSSPPQPSMYLCKIASGTQGHHIFVLREAHDAELISLWHAKLAGMSNQCQSLCESIVSMHLFRMGIDERSSVPTVIINTSLPLDETHKRMFQYTISDSLLSARPAVQIDFRQSRVRRSTRHSYPGLPPICQPRNREFSSIPGTGASIGIAGSVEHTATLGCYFLLNGKPMALTVDHLLPDQFPPNITPSGRTRLSIAPRVNYYYPSITHISEQDRQDILGYIIGNFIAEYTRSSAHLCDICADLRSPASAYHNLISRLTTLGNSLWPISCPLYQEIRSRDFEHTEDNCQIFQLGKSYAQSSRRSRIQQIGSPIAPRAIRREMDWALFEVLMDENLDLIDLKQYLLSRSSNDAGNQYLRPGSIRPGALIRSLGRTSGHQVGQISNTASIIFHEHYQTEEWCVIKRPETGTDAWIEGGIGVDGDSGALIIDESSSTVYGMLWGRSGNGPATVTLFTPILEVIDDIKETIDKNFGTISATSGGPSVEMLRGQEMPKPPRTTRSVTPPPEVETVPITVRTEEDVSDDLLEQPIPIPGVRRLSSIETGHPRPFERYRGHGSRRHSIPRSMEIQADDEKIDPGQFPGTYTYFRQVIAPEKE